MRIAGTAPRGQLGRHSQRQPTDYGDWSNTHRRLARQRCVKKFLEILIDKPDDEWLMIDASHGKVHASGARGGNQEMSRTKGGSTQNRVWPHKACRLLHKVQEQIVKGQTT